MNSKEIALVSVFSAVWISVQFSLGALISQISGIHGVVQNFVGWLLMLILAEFSGKFGRVSIMATISALATRLARRSAALYMWVVGLGYALGGLIFDMLYFAYSRNVRQRKVWKAYLIIIALTSGLLSNVPYIIFQLFALTFSAFIVWIPTYVPFIVKDVVLNVLGVLTGLSILPLIPNQWKPITTAKRLK